MLFYYFDGELCCTIYCLVDEIQSCIIELLESMKYEWNNEIRHINILTIQNDSMHKQ